MLDSDVLLRGITSKSIIASSQARKDHVHITFTFKEAFRDSMVRCGGVLVTLCFYTCLEDLDYRVAIFL